MADRSVSPESPIDTPVLVSPNDSTERRMARSISTSGRPPRPTSGNFGPPLRAASYTALKVPSTPMGNRLERPATSISMMSLTPSLMDEEIESIEGDELIFDHKHHGKNACIKEQGKLAQRRKRGHKEAVVMTVRPLKDSEVFEVEIGTPVKGVKGILISKGGSMRIGVTTHCPTDLWPTFPNSMKRMCSGTWMMKGEEFLQDGEIVMTLTKHDLKHLQPGARVGVVREPEFGGSLIITINGAPIGIMATGVPEFVYGFVEIFGEVDRVKITETTHLAEESLPVEIKAIRQKGSDIEDLHQLIEQKNQDIEELDHKLMETIEEVKTLQKKVEILSLQKPKKHRTTQTPQRVKKVKETQTASPLASLNGSPRVPRDSSSPEAQPQVEQLEEEIQSEVQETGDPSSPRRRKTKKACCSCCIM